MVLKALNVASSIGHDIVNISRIATLLRSHHPRKFVQTVFSPIEWPTIFARFKHFHERLGVDDVPDEHCRNESTFWSVIESPSVEGFLRDEGEFAKALNDPRCPLGDLFQFCAGRWAAKEAVIKAVAARTISRQQIAIVTPKIYPALFGGDRTSSQKPEVLIEPPGPTVLVSRSVARQRGLRGFASDTVSMPKGKLCEYKGEAYFSRRSKSAISQRHIARISISHDGAYASSVCLASVDLANTDHTDFLIDDGSGPPLHQPEWNDWGWFDADAHISSPSAES